MTSDNQLAFCESRTGSRLGQENEAKVLCLAPISAVAEKRRQATFCFLMIVLQPNIRPAAQAISVAALHFSMPVYNKAPCANTAVGGSMTKAADDCKDGGWTMVSLRAKAVLPQLYARTKCRT